MSGADLTADATLIAPTNYEISETSGTGFTSPIVLSQSGGSLGGDVTIYARLKSGRTVESYDEDITITSTDATDKTVTLNGEVTANFFNVSGSGVFKVTGTGFIQCL